MSKIPRKWRKPLDYSLRIGKILIRIGAYLSIVAGVYYCMKFIDLALRSPASIYGMEAIFILSQTIISLACASILFETIGRRLASEEYRYTLVGSFIVGSILLLPAIFAGILVIIGTLLILCVTEIRKVFT